MAREMKDSGIEWIGEIPKEWEVNSLKHLGQFINGYAFKPEQWGFLGKRIIRIQDLTGSNDNPNYYDGNIDIKYHINNGDILVSWAATLDTFIWNKGEGLLNQHIFKAIHNENRISYKFFYWLLKETMENMNNDNKHGIVMQHVTLDVFNNFKVPLPNKHEQQQIASFLDTQCAHIDSVIEKTRAAIEEYKKLKQSVITQAVTKGIRPNREMKDCGIEWIGTMPKDWLVMPSKWLFYNSDLRKQDGDEQMTASQQYGIITQKKYMELTGSKVVFANKGLEDWKHVEPNDFIISLRSFQGGLEMSESTGCITWHYIVLKPRKEIISYYYKWLFKSEMYIKALQRTCNYIRDGQDLRYSNFVQVPLVEPSLLNRKKLQIF